MPQRWFVRLLVTFSGFCSLVYQVLWDRIARYNFGGDNTSSSVVTGTFLLGLGIGAACFGRWRRRAFLTYALVELATSALRKAASSRVSVLARHAAFTSAPRAVALA